MIVVFEQVLVLFLFAAVGFVLTRCGVTDGAHGGLLSKLLVYVFLPCNVFKTFATRFTVAYLTEHGVEMLISLAVLIAVAVAAHFAGRLLGRERYEGQVYEYSMVVPNAGYMGYALAESLLGTAALLNLAERLDLFAAVFAARLIDAGARNMGAAEQSQLFAAKDTDFIVCHECPFSGGVPSPVP